MRNGWDYERFRDYILRAAAAVHGVNTQADIARLTGITPSLLSKWFRGLEKPSPESLDKVDAGFRARGVDLNVNDLYRLAGRRYHGDGDRPPAPPRPAIGHPLARELDAMLAASSPLPDADRAAIAVIVDRVIAPYRRQMRRRNPA